MYQCSECCLPYEEEQNAADCCIPVQEREESHTPRKHLLRPSATQHRCPSVTHGGKSWLVWLSVDEACPMCTFVYRPR
jgi:hypothetical protein